ncbi:MAG: DUF3866 family protein [Armatimonadetes bacterium]|nr:DUF3866 family protein [Armatimonadota bacterium]
MLTRARGKVVSIDLVRGDAVELTVDVGDDQARAIAYTSLVGQVRVDDEVILNTTAVKLGLGTGGYHFVMANLSAEEREDEGKGHVIKCRYTPVQHAVLSVEEENSPERQAIEKFESLGGMPVVVGQLHSQLAPAAAAIKRSTQHRARVAFIMTDSAALPLAFSRSATELRNKGIIDSTITVGQAFGGEIEAVNVYTGLIAAKQVARADAVVVCPGPGNVGTGSTFGFSSLEQGEVINAVNVLGGSAIAIARISFADPRPRHQGLSHHTLTALSRVALTKCTLALPMIDQMKLLSIQEQIAHSAIHYKHLTRILDGRPGIIELQEKGFKLSSMGRGFDEDPEFFLAAAAAGALAAEMLRLRA